MTRTLARSLLSRPSLIILIYVIEQLTFIVGGTALAVAAATHL